MAIRMRSTGPNYAVRSTHISNRCKPSSAAERVPRFQTTRVRVRAQAVLLLANATDDAEAVAWALEDAEDAWVPPPKFAS
jgi:hypothetical protein